MTILVVDDQPLVREVVRLMLEARGYTVVVADGGPTALRLFSERSIDAAVVDVDMPAMTGVEVSRALLEQASAVGRRVLVWLMTGVTRPGLDADAARVGALGIIPKPFTPAELIARLQADTAGVPA
jgi:CheY-like chemotaxis protein